MKIQLGEPVSSVRGWELGVKVAISQGWVLERPEFCWLATGGTGGPSQQLGRLWDLGSTVRSVCVCVHEVTGDTGTCRGGFWLDRVSEPSCWRIHSVFVCVYFCVCVCVRGCMCLLGIHAQPHCLLDLGARSCSSFTPIRVPDLDNS